MRKTLASFLMLVMFASAIMCGCGHEARAETGVNHHHAGQMDSDHHGKGAALDYDCQKTDMQLPAHVGISKPDLAGSAHFDVALAADASAVSFSVAENRTIRGPPLLYESGLTTAPSILLTTQRLRI